MSDTKHTPGPWLPRGGYDVVKFSNRHPVARIETSESIANADCRLIAFSPDMLSILKSLVWSSENNTGAEPSISCYHRDIDTAKAVIKAAQGERVSNDEQRLIDDLWR